MGTGTREGIKSARAHRARGVVYAERRTTAESGYGRNILRQDAAFESRSRIHCPKRVVWFGWRDFVDGRRIYGRGRTPSRARDASPSCYRALGTSMNGFDDRSLEIYSRRASSASFTIAHYGGVNQRRSGDTSCVASLSEDSIERHASEMMLLSRALMRGPKTTVSSSSCARRACRSVERQAAACALARRARRAGRAVDVERRRRVLHRLRRGLHAIRRVDRNAFSGTCCAKPWTMKRGGASREQGAARDASARHGTRHRSSSRRIFRAIRRVPHRERRSIHRCELTRE